MFTKSTESASKAVELFHQRLNDSKFSEIYADSTPEFKEATKEADFMKFMEAVRRKLGAFQSASSNGWGSNVTIGKTTVTLGYKSKFEHGDGDESFIFVISGDAVKLQRYNISSMALITN